jgi:hypothetical protein
MNADAPADEPPLRSLSVAAVEKARIPDERNQQRSTVLELNGELVLRYLDVHRAGGLKVTR